MFLLELALVLPVVILGGTSLIDTVSVLRSQNALKEAAQASLRCLTTINSPCTVPQEQPSATRQFTYYRVTNPPTIYGDVKRVPASISERVAPLQRYQFDATVLDTVYSATGQQNYQELRYDYSSVADVSYFQEQFGYFVDYVRPTASHRVVTSAIDDTAIQPSLVIEDFRQVVRRNQGTSITFSVPRPDSLEKFGSANLCVTRPITEGSKLPPTCLLSAVSHGKSSKLFSTMMIVLEGRASGGSSSARQNAQVTMTASYADVDENEITIPLGGQQFELNGTNRPEHFIPRGAPAGTVIEGRYGSGLVDKTSKYYDGELSDYSAEKLSFPLNTTITIKLAFATNGIAANAMWRPTRLALYLPTFTKNTTTLSCTNSPTCEALSADVSSCKTLPKLRKGIASVRPVKRTKTTAVNPPTACRVNAPVPDPTNKQFTVFSFGKVSCVNRVFKPVTGTECAPHITAKPCISSNKGVSTAPDEEGIIRAPSFELERACQATGSAAVPAVPGEELLMPGESLATTKQFRVTTPSLPPQPVESQAYQRTCDLAIGTSEIPHPPAVLQYQRTTPILVGTVPGELQPLPADLASADPAALGCFPTRSVDSARTAQLLGDYAYLLAPHPDRGCGYAELLEEAEATVERDSRYDVSFSPPATTPERFAFEDGTKPDACQQFTVGTPEIARERLELIGTFPESNPPAECASHRCVREFAGLVGSSPATSPSVDIARAVAEAKLAYHAYLPNREPDDLKVDIAPPTGAGDDADSFRVSTELTVPLSFSQQSTITHVARGKPEVDGD